MYAGLMRCSNAIITIADNVVGIPESMWETFFDSFRSEKNRGNGLGLCMHLDV
jgi:nitrogen-specific signal transduction histidine kinase